MGRKALHTQEEVFQAANTLATSGKEVTPTTLRDALGGGSLTTIYKHIDAWQETRHAAPLPIIFEMPDNVKTAFSQCWQAAASEASKEIAAIREKADTEIKAIKRRLDEAVEAIEQLESEGEADNAKIEKAEADLAATLTASQQAATTSVAREAALSATAEQMRQQIEAQQTELANVHFEAEASRNQHTAEITRLTTDFTRQLAEAEQKIDATNVRERIKVEEAATATAEVSRLTELLKEQKISNAGIISKLENDKQTLETDLTATRQEIRELTTQLSRTTGELDALRTQVIGQTDVIKSFATQSEKKTK